MFNINKEIMDREQLKKAANYLRKLGNALEYIWEVLDTKEQPITIGFDRYYTEQNYEDDYFNYCLQINEFNDIVKKYHSKSIILGSYRNSQVNMNTVIGNNKLFDDFNIYNKE